MAYSIFNFISSRPFTTGLSTVMGIGTGFVANKFCSRSTAALIGTVAAGISLWQMSREQNPTSLDVRAAKLPADLSSQTLSADMQTLFPKNESFLARSPAPVSSLHVPVTTQTAGQSSSVEDYLTRMVQYGNIKAIAADRLKFNAKQSNLPQFLNHVGTAVVRNEVTTQMAHNILQAYRKDRCIVQ